MIIMKKITALTLFALFVSLLSCKKGGDGNDCEEETARINFRNNTNDHLTVYLSNVGETNPNFTSYYMTVLSPANTQVFREIEPGRRLVRWSRCSNLTGCTTVNSQSVDYDACDEEELYASPNTASDVRYKKEITDLEGFGATARVLSLKPVRYEYDFDKFPRLDAVHGATLGFLAQDLERVVPETVVRDRNGFRSVNYTALIPLLTATIQEQQKRIEALEQKLGN